MSNTTVVVPCYNHANYIERCLRSIFAQTVHPKRLIVVDDGSTDDSAAVIKKTLADCPFENELISRENRGLCATLNEAFALVDTEYFAYIGSDDIWLKNFLEEREKLLDKRKQAVLAFGHSYLIDNDENIFDRTDNWTDFADGDLLPTLLKGQIWTCHSVLFRSRFLRNHKWNEQAKLEDYEMYLRLTTEGEFALDSRVLVGWRLHGSNTSDDFPKIFKEFLASLENVQDLLGFSDAELSKIRKQIKFNYITNFIRTGNVRKAFTTLLETRECADSYSQIANILFRMAIPQPLFQWNRERKRRLAMKTYGKLDY